MNHLMLILVALSQSPVEKEDVRANVTVLLVPETIACGPHGYIPGNLSPCEELDANEVQNWIDAETFPMCRQAQIPPDNRFYFYEAFSVTLRSQVEDFVNQSNLKGSTQIAGPSLMFLFDWDDDVRGVVHLEREQPANTDKSNSHLDQYSSPKYTLPGGKNRWVAHHRADSLLLSSNFRWRLVLTPSNGGEDFVWYFGALPQRALKNTKREEE